jgi:hypothetical protein
MQDMAVFFSRIFIINNDINLYVKLIKSLKNKTLLSESIFSTLNYDCLLEFATVPDDIEISYFPPFINSNGSISILKLHGSCNFILNGIKTTRSIQFTSGAGFDSGNGFKSIDPNETNAYCHGDNGLYPIMSLFMRGKPNQIGSGHIIAIQNV